ncbi:MAG TPA: lysophospholipid acyltransferase family protein [Acidisarcina sp.]|nr:lysophospholipid acyltransferase family protein [Acidisarcina sp.]
MIRRPSPLPRRYRILSNAVQAPLFGLATIGFGSLSIASSFLDREGRLQHRIARIWAKTTMGVSLSPVTVIGEENLRRASVAVYACNHTSYMDTPVLFSSLPFQFRILAKQQLWKVPFIGWHLNRSGQIPVDSTTQRSSITSLSAGVRALKSGMPLVVFPEGGRTMTGHPQAFLSGAAYLALRAQVPLVPMALVDVYGLLPIHTTQFHPRPVKLVVGEPIATEGHTTRELDALNKRLREEVCRLYYKHGGMPKPVAAPAELPAAATQPTPLEPTR